MNSNTTHSRRLRAATAAAWSRTIVAAGGRRLTVLLPPASAEGLARLEKKYGSATAVVVAGIEKLEELK